jgi:hypothetical protein
MTFAIQNEYHHELEQLVSRHGQAIGHKKFRQLKETKPTASLDLSFVDIVMEQIPKGFAQFDKAEWGNENQESDSYVHWCQNFYFKITDPEVSRHEKYLFLEVGDFHYYMAFANEEGGHCGGETFKSIHDGAVTEILELLLEELRDTI